MKGYGVFVTVGVPVGVAVGDGVSVAVGGTAVLVGGCGVFVGLATTIETVNVEPKASPFCVASRQLLV